MTVTLTMYDDADVERCRWFFQQLMVSVDYLHRRMEIAHRHVCM